MVVDPSTVFRQAAEYYLLKCPDIESVQALSGLAGLEKECFIFKPHILLIDYKLLKNCRDALSLCAGIKKNMPALIIAANFLYQDSRCSDSLKQTGISALSVSKQNFVHDVKHLIHMAGFRKDEQFSQDCRKLKGGNTR